jgi:hypothetical protein
MSEKSIKELSSNMSDELEKFRPQPVSEPELVLAELKALDGGFKTDEAALARLNARMTAEFARNDREHARIVAEYEDRIARRVRPIRPRPTRLSAMGATIVALLLVIPVGVLLELTVGRRFITAFPNEFRSVMPWVFLISSVLLSMALIQSKQFVLSLHSGISTSSIRLLMLVVAGPLLSGAVIAASFGWAAAWGSVVGYEPVELTAKVLGTRESSSSRAFSCQHSATLKVGHASTQICVDNILSGPALNFGDSVVVAGRASATGVLVEAVRKEPIVSRPKP